MNLTLTTLSWRAWLPWLILLGAIALLQLLGEYQPLRLEFPLTSSDWYQLFSCHFVHLNTSHWLHDSLALLVIGWLFTDVYSWKSWLLTLVAGVLCVGIGLSLWHPSLHSYAGLSGVLHAFFAMGCLLLFRTQPRLASLLAVLLILKLVIQPFVGPLLISTTGYVVANLAHDYGAIGGLLSGLLWISTGGCQQR